MTGETKSDAGGQAMGEPSLLPFNPADLVAMRVRPADFARMVQVSKQTVSRWIKEGKIVLGPDGRLDPSKAVREVLERTDPARLRARLFKSATESREELRSRAESAEAALRAARREIAQIEGELADALGKV